MKISKIIFISLLGAIALFIFIAGLDSGINWKGTGRINFANDKKTIPSFKALNLINSDDVMLIQDDSAFIELEYPKYSLVPHINYTIKEDTLKLYDIKRFPSHRPWIKIHSTNALTRIELKNSSVLVQNLNLEKLFLDMDQSHLSESNKSLKSAVKLMDVNARNYSDFDLYSSNFQVDSLSLKLQNSRSLLTIVTNKLNADLSNSSSFNARQPNEITLKRDLTSKFTIY